MLSKKEYNKYVKSQNAHLDLYSKHSRRNDRLSRRKASCHWNFYSSQNKNLEILTPKQRRIIWNSLK